MLGAPLELTAAAAAAAAKATSAPVESVAQAIKLYLFGGAAPEHTGRACVVSWAAVCIESADGDGRNLHLVLV